MIALLCFFFFFLRNLVEELSLWIWPHDQSLPKGRGWPLSQGIESDRRIYLPASTAIHVVAIPTQTQEKKETELVHLPEYTRISNTHAWFQQSICIPTKKKHCNKKNLLKGRGRLVILLVQCNQNWERENEERRKKNTGKEKMNIYKVINKRQT